MTTCNPPKVEYLYFYRPHRDNTYVVRFQVEVDYAVVLHELNSAAQLRGDTSNLPLFDLVAHFRFVCAQCLEAAQFGG